MLPDLLLCNVRVVNVVFVQETPVVVVPFLDSHSIVVASPDSS